MWTHEQLEEFRAGLEERDKLRQITHLEGDLSAFFRAAWHVIEPETPLVWSWFYDYFAEWMQIVSSGEFKTLCPDKRGIIFNIPPRCAKSGFITVSWPVWSWIKFPAKRFLCASYADKLACDHSIKRRNLITSRWFQERFGSRFSLKFDRNRIDFFENDKTGYCIATSVGGTGTGFGGDICVGDDLLNAEDAFSEASRASTNRWIDATFSTRLNNPSTGVFLYVSQRLAQDDVTGHLLEQQKGQWIHIKIPLEAREDETYTFPLSGKVLVRKAGDVLQPERFNPVVVENLKQNSREWAGQYQQEPVPELGGIIKRHWWKFYVRPGESRPEGCLMLPDRFDEMAQSWDMSFKDTKHSDFVCGGVWARKGAMKYLMPDIVWDRLDFPATKKAVISLTARWPKAHAKWVEDKANGTAIIAELNTEISGLIPVEPIGSKEARLHAASPDVEAGNVVLPHPGIAPWVPRFIDECAAACCGGKYDDAADMMSQAINKMRDSGLCLGYIEYLKQEAGKLAQVTAAAPVSELRCPNCDGTTSIIKVAGQWRCNLCGKQWGLNLKNLVQMPNRNELLAARR
jgi:predicted phage terminase large subunit-like protein